MTVPVVVPSHGCFTTMLLLLSQPAARVGWAWQSAVSGEMKKEPVRGQVAECR